ncbi:MAG: hypothetical protein HPY61_10300 [Methanotrichaceae archaeon]|nr:hypothetical protein [Methanotrichaceae archaeon]
MDRDITLTTPLTRKRLKTPRAAAIAGIVFSLLLMVSLMLIRLSVPAEPAVPGEWMADPILSRRIVLALNIIPFAGIAFLWFIGVVRDLIGDFEDRFFSTVFLGSGLIFVAMLFASAAVGGGLISSFLASPGQLQSSDLLTFSRAVTYSILYVYAMKMAGVFMISTATVGLRTEVMPRWLVWLGYALAAVLLLSISYWEWMALLFPMWVLLLSVHILVKNYRLKLPP